MKNQSKADNIISRLLWLSGLAMMLIHPPIYAGANSVGSEVPQPPLAISQESAKQEQLVQKKLHELRRRQHNSEKKAIRVGRSFNTRQRQQFEEISKLAIRAARNPRAINELKANWSGWIHDIAKKNRSVDVDALIKAVMRDLYQQEVRNLEQALVQVQHLNDRKRQSKKELNRARQHRQKMYVAQREGKTLPVFRPVKIPEVKSNSLIKSSVEMDAYIKEMENKLTTIGDDAQLANIDLQNALQRQQQILQTLSNISKLLHDTAMAVIRKMS